MCSKHLQYLSYNWHAGQSSEVDGQKSESRREDFCTNNSYFRPCVSFRYLHPLYLILHQCQHVLPSYTSHKHSLFTCQVSNWLSLTWKKDHLIWQTLLTPLEPDSKTIIYHLEICEHVKFQYWRFQIIRDISSWTESGKCSLVDTFVPLRSASSHKHLVKCCVPVKDEPCFGRYGRHNSSGRGKGSWRMEKWQSRFFRE